MTRPAAASRFGSLAQAVKDLAAAADAAAEQPSRPEQETSRPDTPREVAPSAPGASVHKPSAALAAVSEGLRERVARLEAELAQQSGRNTELSRELELARSAASRAGEAVDEFLFLDPSAVRDELPRDRLPGAFAGPEFEELLADIRDNGQNDAITVRPAPGDDASYEIAAGRRRLAACQQLGRQVLARVRRGLDDAAMLRVQFSENERREDISALERARWFAEVKARLNAPAKDVAAQFNLDPSTLSLYLRLARFPPEIARRLREPRQLAMLRARRVMEAVERDPAAIARILEALDLHARASADRHGEVDPEDQIGVLLRAAEGREGGRAVSRDPVPDRRHVVHRGRRVGTLTRNGGQWVFRFASSIGDDVVQALADRIGDLVAEVERKS